MFTGIVDHCGMIEATQSVPGGLRILIKSDFTDLTLGESIAVDGVCLTVTDIEATRFYCDISPETLAVTTANNFFTGQLVNLERALLPSARIGGHFVLGHVDLTGSLQSVREFDQFL